MNKNNYMVIGKFRSYEKNMIIVKLQNKAVCVMNEEEYYDIVRNEMEHKNECRDKVA